MFFEITYALIFAILIFIALRFSKLGKIDGLNKWDLSFAFAIKSLASLVFIYIYTWHYGTGILFSDSTFYILDGTILNNVFYESPINYLKLLTGIGENDSLIQQYLSKTEMWSRPLNVINNDSKNIIRINSIISFFSLKNNYIHFIIFNLFALSGLKNIFLYFKKYILINERIFFYAIVLLPSLLFWSSGVLKEPLLIFALGLFLKALANSSQNKFKRIAFILCATFILINFKAYVLVAMLIPLLFVYSSHYFFKKQSLIFNLILIFSCVTFSIIAFPKQRQKVVEYISVKQFNFENTTRGGMYYLKENDPNAYFIQPEEYKNIRFLKDSFVVVKNTTAYSFNRSKKNNLLKLIEPADSTKKFLISSIWIRSNSYIKTKMIFSSFRQMIFNIPEALINSLFKPFPQDKKTKFNYLQFLETSLLFGFLFFSIFKRRKFNKNDLIVIIALTLFIFILSLFIGWTTTVAGAIVRYRIPSYLALLILTFIIYNPTQKWKKKENIS